MAKDAITAAEEQVNKTDVGTPSPNCHWSPDRITPSGW